MDLLESYGTLVPYSGAVAARCQPARNRGHAAHAALSLSLFPERQGKRDTVKTYIHSTYVHVCVLVFAAKIKAGSFRDDDDSSHILILRRKDFQQGHLQSFVYFQSLLSAPFPKAIVGDSNLDLSREPGDLWAEVATGAYIAALGKQDG